MSNKPLVKNAADETQVKNAEIKVKLNEDQKHNDLKWILATEQGRRFVWRLLETTGIFKSSFTGSSETYFLEGQRNVGLKLLADVMECEPQAYLKMYIDSKKDK